MIQARRRDEIDQIVDDLIANPDRAEELKGKLHLHFQGEDTPERRRSQLRLMTLLNDADDRWDNVPV